MDGLASSALQRLIGQIVQEQGFHGVSRSALVELEQQILQFLAGILFFSHELALTGRRSQPNVLDVSKALTKAGFTFPELSRFLASGPPLETPITQQEPLPPPETPILPYRPTYEELEARLPIQPDFFPPLPPEHSWKQTPVFPQGMEPQTGPKGDLSTVTTDNRVRTTRMIESSLRSLIRNTNAALSQAPLAKAAAEAEAMANYPPPLQEVDENVQDIVQPLGDNVQEMGELGQEAGDTNGAAPPVSVSGQGEQPTEAAIDPPQPAESEIPAPQPVPMREGFDKEHLVRLQLLASTNPEESMDASIVNWQLVGRRRGVAAVDTNAGVVGKGKRLKWST